MRNIFVREVDLESANEIIKEIIEYNSTDDELESELKDYEREEIVLHINSYGGCTYSAFSIYDAIKTSNTKVKTICYTAMSAGLIIYLAGHQREIHKNATVMYHEIASDIYDSKLSIMKNVLDECKRLEKIVFDIILSNSEVTMEMLEQNKFVDLFINSEKAISLKIAHRYVGDK